MKPYFIKTPKIISAFYKKYVWKINTKKKEIFLTFDDGPTPKITKFVLDELKKYQAKATFFCIGKNIENHPLLYNRILADGHQTGNHTQNHCNGWKTTKNTYIDNVEKCQNLIKPNSTKLFRPPYGKIKKTQAKTLKNKGYKIIMWSVLSGDFDTKLTKEKCLKNVIENTKQGDIIVFHDSLKSQSTLQYVLPKVLTHFSKKGFSFNTIL